MRVFPRRRRFLLSASSFGPLFFLASILVPTGAALYFIVFANPPVPTTSAVLSTVNNVVEVQGVSDDAPRRAQEEQVLVAGDDVRTLDQGRGVITFSDLSNLVLDSGSELTILPPQRRDGGVVNRFSQSFGTSFSQFSNIARGGGRYEIQTPAGIISVRDGAVLRVGVGQTQQGKATVQVIVLQGEVEVRPPGTAAAAAGGTSAGAVIVSAGQEVVAIEDEKIPEAVPFVPENDIVIRLFSPFWMLVVEPGTGLSTGLIPPGVELLQISLSLTTSEGSTPQTVRLNEVVSGTYTIYLLPKREGGAFRVTAEGRTKNRFTFSDERSGFSGGCEWFYLLMPVDVDRDGLMTFGELQGPFPLPAVPGVVGRSIDSPCPPPKPLQAQVGGVQATATPQPETPTAVPTTAPPSTPTPVSEVLPISPTEAPTSVPPTSVAPTSVPPTSIPLVVDPPVPPTEVPEPTQQPPPPPPPPPPRPDIGIDPTEESVLGGSGSPLSLGLALAPGLVLGLAGLIKRRGRSR